MNIATEPLDPGRVILHLEGRFDADTADTFKQAAKALAAGGVKFITVDLARVSFLDSSGLSALVSVFKTLRPSGGQLNLAAAGPQARTALRLTLLERVLPVFETVAEAVAHIKA
jgi:anti-sigma B factor antagonist